MASNKKISIKHLVLDVDGVFTDGQFHYTADGKSAKIFGPDDHDALLLIRPYIDIVAVSGDKKGFAITKKRIEEDMKIPLYQVSTFDRVRWMKNNYGNLKDVAYMGDGIFDAMVFDAVGYAIAPANAFFKIKEHADYITTHHGGAGAVAEACFHIMDTFFKPLDVLNLKIKKGGEWGNNKFINRKPR